MKKLFLGSAALLLFSCAIIIFQISCKKDAVAQRPAGNGGKILFNKSVIGVFVGLDEIWLADYDGSNATRIQLSVPGWKVNDIKLSPDGTKLFFTGMDSSRLSSMYVSEIFSADVDGSNVQQITHSNAEGKSAALLMTN